MLDEPLPVHLVLVFLARKVLGHLEDLDELPDSEPGPLSLISFDLMNPVAVLVVDWLRIVDLNQLIRVHIKFAAALDHVQEPSV